MANVLSYIWPWLTGAAIGCIVYCVWQWRRPREWPEGAFDVFECVFHASLAFLLVTLLVLLALLFIQPKTTRAYSGIAEGKEYHPAHYITTYIYINKSLVPQNTYITAKHDILVNVEGKTFIVSAPRDDWETIHSGDVVDFTHTCGIVIRTCVDEMTTGDK